MRLERAVQPRPYPLPHSCVLDYCRSSPCATLPETDLPFLATAAVLAILPLLQHDLILIWHDGVGAVPFALFDPQPYRIFAIIGAIAFMATGALAEGLLARLPDGLRAPAYAALGSVVPLVMIAMAITTFGCATWLTKLWQDKRASLSYFQASPFTFSKRQKNSARPIDANYS